MKVRMKQRKIVRMKQRKIVRMMCQWFLLNNRLQTFASAISEDQADRDYSQAPAALSDTEKVEIEPKVNLPALQTAAKRRQRVPKFADVKNLAKKSKACPHTSKTAVNRIGRCKTAYGVRPVRDVSGPAGDSSASLTAMAERDSRQSNIIHEIIAKVWRRLFRRNHWQIFAIILTIFLCFILTFIQPPAFCTVYKRIPKLFKICEDVKLDYTVIYSI